MPFTRTRAALVLGPAVLAVALVPTLLAGAASGATAPAKSKTVTAVVVSSWDDCGGSGAFWPTLMANQAQYGTTKISIDADDADVCGATFTLAGLEASGADVVILDDPAGFGRQYTPDEVTALQTYLDAGHSIIGTYLTFAYASEGIDNSALAPLFGLKQSAGWTGGTSGIVPTYTEHGGTMAAALFRNIPSPYTSSGFAQSQTPGTGAWSKHALAGAKIEAVNADGSAAITIYKGSGYHAIYIANMPEYSGGTQDQQFFYNALIYPKTH